MSNEWKYYFYFIEWRVYLIIYSVHKYHSIIKSLWVYYRIRIIDLYSQQLNLNHLLNLNLFLNFYFLLNLNDLLNLNLFLNFFSPVLLSLADDVILIYFLKILVFLFNYSLANPLFLADIHQIFPRFSQYFKEFFNILFLLFIFWIVLIFLSSSLILHQWKYSQLSLLLI